MDTLVLNWQLEIQHWLVQSPIQKGNRKYGVIPLKI
jgi:hypothetical protein